MKNKYFPEESISTNDLFFVCYMVERVARKIKQRNSYVVNQIGKEKLYHFLSLAQVLHSSNPLQVEAEWIEEFNLQDGTFDITNVDKNLCDKIPTPLEMGSVYSRLIDSVSENYVDGLIEVYNSDLCDVIDNYNSSAYYEPSYYITRAYLNGGF
jgi:hypothetical protein